MTFKLWVPGRAPNHKLRKLFGPYDCEACKNSGEEKWRFIKGIGYSYIPCKECGGTGKKIDIRADFEPVGR